MPVLTHTHSMIFFKEKPICGIPTVLYRCFDPLCTYKVDVAFLFGKLNKCPQCGREWILSREDLRRKIPKCLDCADHKIAKQYRKVKEVLESVKLGEDESEQKDPNDFDSIAATEEA